MTTCSISLASFLTKHRFLDNPRGPEKIPTCQTVQKLAWENGFSFSVFFLLPCIRALKLQSEVYTMTECHRSQVQPVPYKTSSGNNMQRSITLTTSCSHLENTAKGKDSHERQTSHVAIRLKKKKKSTQQEPV